MGIAQIILLSLLGIILFASAKRHGQPREGKINFWAHFIGVAIVFSLLHWGGFFN